MREGSRGAGARRTGGWAAYTDAIQEHGTLFKTGRFVVTGVKEVDVEEEGAEFADAEIL